MMSSTHLGLVKLAMRQGISAPRSAPRESALTDRQHNVIDGILLAFVFSALLWGAIVISLI